MRQPSPEDRESHFRERVDSRCHVGFCCNSCSNRRQTLACLGTDHGPGRDHASSAGTRCRCVTRFSPDSPLPHQFPMLAADWRGASRMGSRATGWMVDRMSGGLRRRPRLRRLRWFARLLRSRYRANFHPQCHLQCRLPPLTELAYLTRLTTTGCVVQTAQALHLVPRAAHE